MYVALVRVGEASGTLDQVLEVLADERRAPRRCAASSATRMRYPAFVLLAAIGVLLFFLLFVLPQFAAVLQRFRRQARSDRARCFIGLSDFLRANGDRARRSRRRC